MPGEKLFLAAKDTKWTVGRESKEIKRHQWERMVRAQHDRASAYSIPTQWGLLIYDLCVFFPTAHG